MNRSSLVHSREPESHFNPTRFPHGFAMPNSASGHTGVHNLLLKPETGMHAGCIFKATANTNTTLSAMAIPQNSATKTSFLPGKVTNSIQTILSGYTKKLAPNICKHGCAPR